MMDGMSEMVDPMRGMTEIVAWVRPLIGARKATAEAATQKEWVYEAGAIHRGHHMDEVVDWVYEDADAEHIVLNQPRDTIAQCEADLALLDRCELVIRSNELRDKDEDGTRISNPTARKLARYTIRALASGYRNRDGWKDEWAPV
jgi:hypothetical protein